MNASTPAGEAVEYALAKCWNHDDRLAVVVGPTGEPLCEPCAVTLARDIKRNAKAARRSNRLRGAAPSVKTRG